MSYQRSYSKIVQINEGSTLDETEQSAALIESDLASATGACPGFGQDRVNFHWNPGRGTAGHADPTWPNRAGCSIPCALMLGSGGGGNTLAARE